VKASEHELEFLRVAWQTHVVGKIGAESLVFVDEMGSNTSLAPVHAWEPRGERAREHAALCRPPAPRTLHALGEHDERRDGDLRGRAWPCVAVVGNTTAAVFEAYRAERALAPALRPGRCDPGRWRSTTSGRTRARGCKG
jgi:hypothetical protein